MRLLSSSAWTAGTSLLVAAASFCGGVLLARVLGPEGRGVYALVMLVVTLAAGLAQAGLGQSFVYTTRQRNAGARRWLVVASMCGVGLLALAMGIGLWQTLGANVPAALVLGMLGLAMVQAVATFSSNAIQITADARDFNALRLAPSLATLVLLMGLAGLGVLTVQSALWAAVVATVLAAFTGAGLLLAGRRARSLYASGPLEAGWLSGYLGYGVKYHATIVLGILVQNVDKLALTYLASMHDFGVYTVAYNTSRFIGTAQEAISMALYSRFAGRSDSALAGRTATAFQLSFAPMMVLALVIAAASHWLVPAVYGQAYAQAVLPFALLLVECVLGGASWMLAQRFAADGRPGLVLLRQVVSLAPVAAVLVIAPSTNLALWLATAMLASAALRLVLTLLIYRVLLREPVPELLPTRAQLQAVYRRVVHR